MVSVSVVIVLIWTILVMKELIDFILRNLILEVALSWLSIIICTVNEARPDSRLKTCRIEDKLLEDFRPGPGLKVKLKIIEVS